MSAEGVKAKCRPVKLEVASDVLANGLVDSCKGISGPKVRIVVSVGGCVKLLLLVVKIVVGVVITVIKLLKMLRMMRKVVLVVKAPWLAPPKLMMLLRLMLFLDEKQTGITRLAVRAPWVAVAGSV